MTCCAQRDAAALFFPDGGAPAAGAKLTNPDLARTLQAVADQRLVGVL